MRPRHDSGVCAVEHTWEGYPLGSAGGGVNAGFVDGIQIDGFSPLVGAGYGVFSVHRWKGAHDMQLGPILSKVRDFGGGGLSVAWVVAQFGAS